MSTESSYYPDYEEDNIDFSGYVSAFKRRRFQFLIPAAIIFILSVFLALGLPATYRSTATILIEQQEIPRDLVRSTITSFASQQIQVITQRVMTVENVSTLVDKFELYRDEQGRTRLSSADLVDAFSDDIDLDLVSADVIDPRSGRPTEATIAFTLSFDAPSARTAQRVAAELVDLYLAENLRVRSSMAAGTSAFLMAEADALNAELVLHEEKIARFKEINEGALPELYQFNLSVVERGERDLSDTTLRIQELEKREIELSAKLAQLDPSASMVTDSGETIVSDAERLRSLKAEYRKKSAIYHDNHPDLLRLRREIDTLSTTVSGPLDNRGDLAAELQVQRQQLADLKRAYQPDHPKVVNAERLVEELQDKLASLPAASTGSDEVVAGNPAYIFIDTQLKSARVERTRLFQKSAKLKANIKRHEDLIRRAPVVEKEYQALIRDYETAQIRYQEIKAKQREANVAVNLEKGEKGERFTIVEPPLLPSSPFSPNRPAIIFLGLVLSVGVGFGLVVLLESLDNSVRGERAVTNIMGMAPLVAIPYLENAEDRVLRLRERKIILMGAGATVLICLAYSHFFYRPLDSMLTSAIESISEGQEKMNINDQSSGAGE